MIKRMIVITSLIFTGNTHSAILTIPRNLIEEIRTDHLSSAPYITGNSFRAACDFILDEAQIPFDTNNFHNGDIIFVKTDFLNYFFKSIHPQIPGNYILVTHNSDYSNPGAFAAYLNDPKLIAWFGQNSDILYHPKFFPIPIGVANCYWEHGKLSTFNTMVAYAQQKNARHYLLYLNYIDETNSERGRVRKFFALKPFCSIEKFKPHHEYLRDLVHAKFVVCPEGNGRDCHRTWEALLMGAIPIIKHSTLDPLFENLPILLINDWKEVTQDFLEKNYTIMKQKQFCRDAVFVQYWINKILDVKRAAQQG